MVVLLASAVGEPVAGSWGLAVEASIAGGEEALGSNAGVRFAGKVEAVGCCGCREHPLHLGVGKGLGKRSLSSLSSV